MIHTQELSDHVIQKNVWLSKVLQVIIIDWKIQLSILKDKFMVHIHSLRKLVNSWLVLRLSLIQDKRIQKHWSLEDKYYS